MEEKKEGDLQISQIGNRYGLTELQAKIVAAILMNAGDNKMSMRSIGELVGCSHPYVGEVLTMQKCQQAILDMAGAEILLNLGPLIRVGLKRALQGSHPHWQDLLKMSGALKDEPTLTIHQSIHTSPTGEVRSKWAEIIAQSEASQSEETPTPEPDALPDPG